VIYLPAKAGWLGAIFDASTKKLSATNPATGAPAGRPADRHEQLQYVTLALGSALALFLYPHSVTGVLASRAGWCFKRNMVALPPTRCCSRLLALLGYVAIAAGSSRSPTTPPVARTPTRSSRRCPDPIRLLVRGHRLCRDRQSARWSRRQIMSIAAANLWTRNIYKGLLQARRHPEQEAKQGQVGLTGGQARRGSVHRRGRPAVLHRSAADRRRIILQTLPAVAIPCTPGGCIAGLWCRLARRDGLRLYLLYQIPNPAAKRPHFGGSLTLTSWICFGLAPVAGSKIQIYVGSWRW